jgi:hypothetical protein
MLFAFNLGLLAEPVNQAKAMPRQKRECIYRAFLQSILRV